MTDLTIKNLNIQELGYLTTTLTHAALEDARLAVRFESDGNEDSAEACRESADVLWGIRDKIKGAIDTAIENDATTTHCIVVNQDGSYSVALLGYDGSDVVTTWGTYPTYQDACDAAQRDAQERSDRPAIFADPIRATEITVAQRRTALKGQRYTIKRLNGQHYTAWHVIDNTTGYLTSHAHAGGYQQQQTALDVAESLNKANGDKA